MIQSRKSYGPFITIALIVFGAIPVPGTPGEIRPLHATAHFSKDSPATLWKAYVVTPEGKRVYKLSFEPEDGPKDEVIGLDLVLLDARNERTSAGSNLLNPHNWHGLQPFDFLGKDLAQGADKSTFGAHRELKLEGKKLVVRIDIASARVNPLPNGDYKIDELELAIMVDNLQ
jgi:hypothetical protein